MLRRRVKTLVSRADLVHPPPLPPEQIKRIVLPYNGREDGPPGRYCISPWCELIILPAEGTDDEAADDKMSEGRWCG